MEMYANPTMPAVGDKSEGCAKCKSDRSKTHILFSITGKGALCLECLYEHEHPEVVIK